MITFPFCKFVDELYSRYINVTIGIVLKFDWIGAIWIIMKHDSFVVTICII